MAILIIAMGAGITAKHFLEVVTATMAHSPGVITMLDHGAGAMFQVAVLAIVDLQVLVSSVQLDNIRDKTSTLAHNAIHVMRGNINPVKDRLLAVNVVQASISNRLVKLGAIFVSQINMTLYYFFAYTVYQCCLLFLYNLHCTSPIFKYLSSIGISHRSSRAVPKPKRENRMQSMYVSYDSQNAHFEVPIPAYNQLHVRARAHTYTHTRTHARTQHPVSPFPRASYSAIYCVMSHPGYHFLM